MFSVVFLALVSCLVLSVSIQTPLLGPITFQSLHSKVRLTPDPDPRPLSSPPTRPSIHSSTVFTWTPIHPTFSLNLPFSPSNQITNEIISPPPPPPCPPSFSNKSNTPHGGPLPTTAPRKSKTPRFILPPPPL